MICLLKFNKDEIVQILRRYLADEEAVYYQSDDDNVEITGYVSENSEAPIILNKLEI